MRSMPRLYPYSLASSFTKSFGVALELVLRSAEVGGVVELAFFHKHHDKV